MFVSDYQLLELLELLEVKVGETDNFVMGEPIPLLGRGNGVGWGMRVGELLTQVFECDYCC